MEEWVRRALERWPNVPALFGWLSLDRAGRWRIQGEVIRHPRIVRVINHNYGVDDHGRWFFQNGPQRGYMRLEYAPFVLRVGADGESLETHTGLVVTAPEVLYLDDDGSVLLDCEHGPGEIQGTDLDWLLARLRSQNSAMLHDDDVAAALLLPSGSVTGLAFHWGVNLVPVMRLDAALMPEKLGFVREPAPRPGEKTSSGAPD